MKYYLEERFILSEDGAEIDWDAKWQACKTQEEKNAFWFGSSKGTSTGAKEAEEDPRDALIGDDNNTTQASTNNASKAAQNKNPGYYEAVFGKNAEDVKALGFPFRRVLSAFGFKEDTNVWLRFVNTLLKKPVNGFGVPSLTDLDFDMLINAMQKKIIKDADLFIESAKLGKYSLVFNPYLYVDVSLESDQLEYLRIQKRFETNHENDVYKGIRWANICLAEGIGYVKNQKEAPPPIKAGGKLCSIANINKRFESNDKKKNAKTSDIEDKLSGIRDADFARDCYVIAYNNFSITKDKALEKFNSEYGNIPDKTFTDSSNPSKDSVKRVRDLIDFKKSYSDDQVILILKKLLEIVGIDLPSA